MPVIVRPIGSCFAAEVEGVDLTRPVSPADVAAIHAGMDTYAVLVFHDQRIDDQRIDDEQQLRLHQEARGQWLVYFGRALWLTGVWGGGIIPPRGAHHAHQAGRV